MTSMTSFLLKHLYEMMADGVDDSNDFEPLLVFLANNQLPDLICETFVESISFGVMFAIIWLFVAISELNEIDRSHSGVMSTLGCPTKAIADFI